MKDFISTSLFSLYLVFCALAPNLVYGVFDFVQVLFIQLVASGFLAYHWYKRIDFSKTYSGAWPKAFQTIDSKQFEYTNYLDLGFKTKLPFAAGFFNNDAASKVLSERYDLNLLIISFIGEFMIFLTNIEQTNIKHGLFGVLLNGPFPFGKNIIAAIGGYIFLWSFSLALVGLISKVIYQLDSEN